MKLILSLLLILSVQNTAYASAWLQDEGAGEVITSLRYQEGERARQFEVNPYIEWGFQEDLSLGANATYRQSAAKESLGQDFNLGFGEAFAKKRLYKNDFNILSLQGSLGTTADTLNGESSNFNYSANPTAELRLLWGLSSQVGFWLNSEIATRSFFGKKGIELRGEETIGYKTKRDHLLLGQFFWTKNLNDPLGPQDYDSIQFQASWVFPVATHWKMQVGESFTLGGRNVEYVPVYLLSVWYHWK